MTRILWCAAIVATMWLSATATSPLAAILPADATTLDEFWRSPENLEMRDLFNGPWDRVFAPDPDALYTFVKPKTGGINPGMTVRDPLGRDWQVKQPPNTGRNAEGPIEVVLSRVLSAVGYHQPPIYFLPSFRLLQDGGETRVVGGRFRIKLATLRERGEWKWRDNPFAGTRPHHGLLVMLLMFNSSDLKDSNNSIYEFTGPDGRVERWFVVRDLGTALGSTARLTPIRGDPDVFEKLGFIKGVKDGFVDFHYNGRHQDLVDRRVTPADVRWASELLGRLSERQWQDAFRAGGYKPDVAGRFISRLRSKIAEGRALGEPTERF